MVTYELFLFLTFTLMVENHSHLMVAMSSSKGSPGASEASLLRRNIGGLGTMALVAEVPAVLAEWTHVWCMRSFGISNALLFATESEMISAEAEYAECWVALMKWIHLVISCSIPGSFVWSQAGEFPTRWEVKDGKYPVPCNKALGRDGFSHCLRQHTPNSFSPCVCPKSLLHIYFIYIHVLTPLIVVWFKANIIFKDKEW